MASPAPAAAPPPPEQPLFQRPIVSDVQFDYKSGRTAEGYTLESIKAGGLPGLAAYACFYASRAKRPELMGPNQARIGLDPDYVHLFWAELPGFASVGAVVDALLAYAASVTKPEQRTVAVTILDGLAWALAPAHHYVGWLGAVAQVELLAGARRVIDAVKAALAAALGGGPLTPVETSALEEAEAALRDAGRLVDALASRGGTAASAPAVDAVLAATFGGGGGSGSGAVPHHRDAAALVPLAAAPAVDALTQVESLWGVPFEAVAAAWTHGEAALFAAIPVSEWRGAGWDKPRYEHAADGVRRFIDHYNATALWVTAEVLVGNTPEARAATITRMVQVGTTLLRLRNYSGLFAVASGLRRGAVARLAASWALVPPPALERWAAIQAVTGERAVPWVVGRRRPRRPARGGLSSMAPLICRLSLTHNVDPRKLPLRPPSPRPRPQTTSAATRRTVRRSRRCPQGYRWYRTWARTRRR
jgi:hypothetical protein